MKKLSTESKELLLKLKASVSAHDHLDSKRMLAPVTKITRRQVEERIQRAHGVDPLSQTVAKAS